MGDPLSTKKLGARLASAHHICEGGLFPGPDIRSFCWRLGQNWRQTRWKMGKVIIERATGI